MPPPQLSHLASSLVDWGLPAARGGRGGGGRGRREVKERSGGFTLVEVSAILPRCLGFCVQKYDPVPWGWGAGVWLSFVSLSLSLSPFLFCSHFHTKGEGVTAASVEASALEEAARGLRAFDSILVAWS